MEEKNLLFSCVIGLLPAILGLLSTLFLGEVFLGSVLIAVLPVLFARAVFGEKFLQHIEKYYGASVFLEVVMLYSVRLYPGAYKDIILQVLKLFTDSPAGAVANLGIGFEIPILSLVVAVILLSYREGLHEAILEKI